ncbi:hypothetical protein HDU67_002401 [Dinochytrium kinnereticum]|nr:hypothetical protein HDU67_002401 [Dinochytrium kinnereticum]
MFKRKNLRRSESIPTLPDLPDLTPSTSTSKSTGSLDTVPAPATTGAASLLASLRAKKPFRRNFSTPVGGGVVVGEDEMVSVPFGDGGGGMVAVPFLEGGKVVAGGGDGEGVKGVSGVGDAEGVKGDSEVVKDERGSDGIAGVVQNGDEGHQEDGLVTSEAATKNLNDLPLSSSRKKTVRIRAAPAASGDDDEPPTLSRKKTTMATLSRRSGGTLRRNPTATPKIINSDQDLLLAILNGAEILPPKTVVDQTPLRRGTTMNRCEGPVRSKTLGRGITVGRGGTLGRGSVRRRSRSPLGLLSDEEGGDALLNSETARLGDDGSGLVPKRISTRRVALRRHGDPLSDEEPGLTPKRISTRRVRARRQVSPVDPLSDEEVTRSVTSKRVGTLPRGLRRPPSPLEPLTDEDTLTDTATSFKRPTHHRSRSPLSPLAPLSDDEGGDFLVTPQVITDLSTISEGDVGTTTLPPPITIEVSSPVSEEDGDEFFDIDEGGWMDEEGGAGVLRRRTSRRERSPLTPPPDSTVPHLSNEEEEEDDDDLFLDAEQQDENWEDLSPPSPTTRLRGAAQSVVQKVHVSRGFYETLAARAGEVFSHAGSAAQVLATPAGFIAGPAVGGLLSTGGAAAVAAGKAAVKRFGRKETRNRVAQTHAALSKFTAAKLIEAATSTLAGEEGAESSSVRAISQGLTATLEGGYVAGTVSLVASSLAASVDDETRKRVLANSYIAAATEALGHLSNVAPILPRSVRGVADAAGSIATAGQGLRVHEDEDEDEASGVTDED